MKTVLFLIVGVLECTLAQEMSKLPAVETYDQCCNAGGITPINDVTSRCEKKFGGVTPSPGTDLTLCIKECVFNETGALADGKLHVEKFISTLEDEFRLDEEYTEFFKLNIPICDKKVIKVLGKTRQPAECKPYSQLMALCLVKEGFQSCPDKKYLQTNECNKLKDKFKDVKLFD